MSLTFSDDALLWLHVFPFPLSVILLFGHAEPHENFIIYLSRTSFSEPARMSTSSKPLVSKLAQIIVGPYRLLGRGRGVQDIAS